MAVFCFFRGCLCVCFEIFFFASFVDVFLCVIVGVFLCVFCVCVIVGVWFFLFLKNNSVCRVSVFWGRFVVCVCVGVFVGVFVVGFVFVCFCSI